MKTPTVLTKQKSENVFEEVFTNTLNGRFLDDYLRKEKKFYEVKGQIFASHMSDQRHKYDARHKNSTLNFCHCKIIKNCQFFFRF